MIFKFPPIVTALVVQALVFVVLYSLKEHASMFANLSLFELSLLQGALAAVSTKRTSLSYWWVGIQFAAPPLLLLGLAFSIPLWVFPVVLILLLLVFWNVAINRVPLYLTNNSTTEKLLSLMPKEEGALFADLGSGLAGTLIRLAKARPDGQFHGYETAPVPFLMSYIRAKLSGARNVHLHFVSLWNADLSHFDVVYCFLSPVPMPDLYEKAKGEMKKGSRFISNSFVVPNKKPSRTVSVSDGRKTKLYIWDM
ncbi:class I SAM-dependent methyltransferase [Sneathiella sp. P13V-1]|uniref:class I SAM-dependent methyltransferase n=1 Tax=Sneathiella sp. P13V-1 TaxID=2697366 RepID=UPI00187BBAF4|nr:class I SAM-dependent methyltransferase [Sneathiella sp. P13V-1]MBE7636900.1 class I SAM-dependent methyltransferase [Sneathiella sp. P13V-1]